MRPLKVHPALELPFPATLPTDDSPSSRAVHEEVLFLFDECALGLRRYVGSFGLGAVTTDDILQDVFLSLFRHLSLGRPRHNLKGWLFRVAHNLALKHRQKTLRRQRTEGDWNATVAEGVIDPAGDPEQQLSDDRRRLRLWQVLRAMPERDRQCVYLRAEGLCYRDIARSLGMSLGSVAKSLTRAFTRLTGAELE
jgi:RNA polymerase sigma-70 factor (ECF subfamily)